MTSPQDLSRAQARASRMLRTTLFLAGVIAVTAVIMVPIFLYEPDVGGESRKRDLKELAALLMLTFAGPAALVATLLTIAYLRWSNRWTRYAYGLGLFVILVANAVLLLTGGWYEYVVDRRSSSPIPGWYPWALLALSLFVASAPRLQARRRSRAL